MLNRTATAAICLILFAWTSEVETRYSLGMRSPMDCDAVMSESVQHIVVACDTQLLRARAKITLLQRIAVRQEPGTRNPELETRNPELETRNPELETI